MTTASGAASIALRSGSVNGVLHWAHVTGPPAADARCAVLHEGQT
jgi:hypothetical protein